MTDDQGRYGFSGLCAGSATIQATLPGGRLTSLVTLELTGKNQASVTLNAATQPASPSATATTGGQPAAGQTPSNGGPTAEPEMPTTGSMNWLLVGGAALGVLLLMSVGARRVFLMRGSPSSHDSLS